MPSRRRCKTNFVKAVGEPRILRSTLLLYAFLLREEFLRVSAWSFELDDWFVRAFVVIFGLFGRGKRVAKEEWNRIVAGFLFEKG